MRFLCKWLFLGLIFAMVSACAPKNYEQYLLSHYGFTKEELIAAWGEPTEINLRRDGGQELVYNRPYPQKMLLKQDVDREEGTVTEEQAVYVTQTCITTFLILDGFVVMWDFKGKCLMPEEYVALNRE